MAKKGPRNFATRVASRVLRLEIDFVRSVGVEERNWVGWTLNDSSAGAEWLRVNTDKRARGRVGTLLDFSIYEQKSCFPSAENEDVRILERWQIFPRMWKLSGELASEKRSAIPPLPIFERKNISYQEIFSRRKILLQRPDIPISKFATGTKRSERSLSSSKWLLRSCIENWTGVERVHNVPREFVRQPAFTFYLISTLSFTKTRSLSQLSLISLAFPLRFATVGLLDESLIFI